MALPLALVTVVLEHGQELPDVVVASGKPEGPVPLGSPSLAWTPKEPVPLGSLSLVEIGLVEPSEQSAVVLEVGLAPE